MDIKDYLHLYLGCDVMHENGTTATTVNVDTSTLGFINHDTLSYGDTYKERIKDKLILRPLSDMTKEEGAWCLQHVFCPGNNYPINDFKLELVGENKSNPRISIDNNWFTESLTFGNKMGSVWSVDRPAQNIKIPATLFTYLLSKGFDLFGLIETGLAIDKTTLK